MDKAELSRHRTQKRAGITAGPSGSSCRSGGVGAVFAVPLVRGAPSDAPCPLGHSSEPPDIGRLRSAEHSLCCNGRAAARLPGRDGRGEQGAVPNDHVLVRQAVGRGQAIAHSTAGADVGLDGGEFLRAARLGPADRLLGDDRVAVEGRLGTVIRKPRRHHACRVAVLRSWSPALSGRAAVAWRPPGPVP